MGNLQVKEAIVNRLTELKGTHGRSFSQVIEYLLDSHEVKEQQVETSSEKTTMEQLLQEMISIRQAAWFQISPRSGGEPPIGIADPVPKELKWKHESTRGYADRLMGLGWPTG